MPFKLNRKTFRIGNSYGITLPQSWCEYYGERAKLLTIMGDKVLVIAPQGLEAEAQRIIEEEETAMRK